MKILVDADSCPKPARELIQKRAVKLSLNIIFAANRPIPFIENVQMEICSNSANSADDRLVELAEEGDIAITRDLPLAKRLLEKNIFVIDDRGRIFTHENINELVSMRNFMVSLADYGLGMERIANYSKKDLKSFADSFDKILTRRINN
jgi:uncharacterized protein YaiI (UPF0178 family)